VLKSFPPKFSTGTPFRVKIKNVLRVSQEFIDITNLYGHFRPKGGERTPKTAAGLTKKRVNAPAASKLAPAAFPLFFCALRRFFRGKNERGFHKKTAAHFCAAAFLAVKLVSDSL